MRNYFALLFLSIFLAACGGGGGSGGNATGTTIPVGSVSGTTFDGLISNANVNVYDFTTGTKGALLASAVSDSKGQYSLSLKVESRPILLEITDGTYTEEAVVTNQITLNAIGAPSRKLSALANYTTNSTVKIAITSFTHMAAGLAAYEISKGTAVATAINDANTRVSTLAGFNILSTMPIQVTDPNNANGNLVPELKYGFLEAAISMWTNNNAPAGLSHIAPYTSIDFVQQLYQDISADGLLDGFGVDPITGAKVQLTFGATKLGVDVYRLGLGVSVIQMAASSANKSTRNGAALLPYTQAYVGSMDAMFNNVTPLPIPSPTVAITSPATGIWARKLVNVTASTSDAIGLGAIDILIDNVVVPASAVAVAVPMPLTASSVPSVTVNTAIIPDGAHTVGVRTTNLAGLTTTNSIQLKIDNTPPTSTVAEYLTAVLCTTIVCQTPIIYVPGGISGVASDAYSGPASVVIVGISAATTPAANGSWTISQAGSIVLGSTVRVKDVAGNCTDYIGSPTAYTWGTVVSPSPACP